MTIEKKYTVVKLNHDGVELAQTLANLISIRNYLYMVSSNIRPSAQNKGEYIRINSKIEILDKRILNLCLTLNVPFDIQVEEIENAD